MKRLLKELITRKYSKQIAKTEYDVNAPIKEYSEEQIIKRIIDELGENAASQYIRCIGIDNDLLKYKSSGYYESEYEIATRFFINDFFKQAVVRKSKKIYFENVKRNANSYNYSISEETVKAIFAKIDEIADDQANNAREEAEKNEKIKLGNAEEMPKIEALFEEELNK